VGGRKKEEESEIFEVYKKKRDRKKIKNFQKKKKKKGKKWRKKTHRRHEARDDQHHDPGVIRPPHRGGHVLRAAPEQVAGGGGAEAGHRSRQEDQRGPPRRRPARSHEGRRGGRGVVCGVRREPRVLGQRRHGPPLEPDGRGHERALHGDELAGLVLGGFPCFRGQGSEIRGEVRCPDVVVSRQMKARLEPVQGCLGGHERGGGVAEEQEGEQSEEGEA
jgi:hypothetical protein